MNPPLDLYVIPPFSTIRVGLHTLVAGSRTAGGVRAEEIRHCDGEVFRFGTFVGVFHSGFGLLFQGCKFTVILQKMQGCRGNTGLFLQVRQKILAVGRGGGLDARSLKR